MKIKKFHSLQFLAEQMRLACLRFPAVIVVALIATIVAIYFERTEVPFLECIWIFSLLLGFPIFLTSTLWRENRGLTASKFLILEWVVGATFIFVHHYVTDQDLTKLYFFRYFHLSLALHLMVAFVPFLGMRNSPAFWQLNKAIFLRLMYSALNASVLCSGLMIALGATQMLFDIKFTVHIYFDLWIFCTIFFQTWHFVAGLPQMDRNLEKNQEYPKGLRVFVQYLLIPLVSLYMTILYAYMGKIILTQIWPSGLVGWLVSAMSVLGVFNLLLIDPEKGRAEYRWIQTYGTAFYSLILPLLGMLFVAIGTRMSEYGVTELRYALLVLVSLAERTGPV